MAKKIGLVAEDKVANFFLDRGYSIEAKNVSYSFGELDLVVRKKNTLVFCEVKYRKNVCFSSPLEAITAAKQRKIILSAKAYLNQYHRHMPDCRFDVVTVVGDLNNPVIEHYEDAFWDEG